MHFRSVLGGTLALLLLSSVVAPASSTGQPADSGFSFHLPKLGLSGIFGERKKPDQQQVAQQSDGTTTPALEEQLRQMNGKIEELNFQVLQMQEQIRKQQEDNEFRFQQLEGGSAGRSKAGRAEEVGRRAHDRQQRRRGAGTRRRPMRLLRPQAARASRMSSSNRPRAIPATW